ncbi:MAG: 4-hydroxy-3-methylbut-2-enyl diphosphate reductase [Lachnospiraceae bacterium]|nr:4-hydroxy-3-methylbut-2-enyl diphosphate reductase [Lachnospiraceae bacterium]
MEVILADNAGFCFGVKRAVDTVYEQTKTGEKIYTYGPIIHNKEVVADLRTKGVNVIESEAELETIKEGCIIIRSHGLPESICEKIERQGLKCVDATCPFVKRIHDIVRKESEAGKQIVIIGNAGHPEVEGIMGWCRTPAIVIESIEEAEKFEYDGQKEICIVSQTTYNYNKFQDIVEIFTQKGYNVIVVNTICNATEVRQAEAAKIAAQVDIMIVIGDNHSSNTRKLYEICMKECENTHFIQVLDDLHLDLTKSVRLVGITAGASTPNNIIEEVQNYVRFNF